MEPGTNTSQSKSSGFSLLELMVAIAIIAIMATIAVPNLARLTPGYARKQFTTGLNSLISLAWQDALNSGRLHRLWFNMEKRIVKLEKAMEKKDANGHPQYEAASNAYIQTSYTWPESIEIKEFFIEGKDMLNIPGKKINEIWFYIFPDASTQEVTINIFNSADTEQSQAGSRFSLWLNPFLVKFNLYETFGNP